MSQTSENQVCKNSIEFIRTAIQNEFTNPLGSYLKRESTFDMSHEDTKKLWSFLIVKSFEADSTLIPLTIHLLDNKIVTPPDSMAKVAALHHVQLKKMYNAYTEPLESINKFMEDCHFNEGKLVAQNDKVDALFHLYETVFKNSSEKDIKELNQLFDDSKFSQFKTLLPQFVLDIMNAPDPVIQSGKKVKP